MASRRSGGDGVQYKKRRQRIYLEIVSGFGTYFNIIKGCRWRMDDVMVGMSSMNACDYILVTKSG